MKRITILRRDFLERSRQGGWFKPVEDIKILIDLTDKKLESTLKDLNKTYRSNFYKVWRDYKVSNNTGREEFIKDYLRIGLYHKWPETENLAIQILQELK